MFLGRCANLKCSTIGQKLHSVYSDLTVEKNALAVQRGCKGAATSKPANARIAVWKCLGKTFRVHIIRVHRGLTFMPILQTR